MKNVFKLKFGKKKDKKGKGKGSIHNASTRRKKGKIRRRASFVSTPLHGRRPPARTGSVVKRKPHYVVDPATQKLIEVHRRPTIDAANTKPVLRPPPGLAATAPGDREHSSRSSSGGGGGRRDVMGSPQHSTSSRSSHDPLDKLDDSDARPRTQEDIDEWMSWRIKVNEQLASYVLKDMSDLGENIPMGAFPKTMTNESLGAILHHAFHEEEQKSSLDKLSYMIYGIPRVGRDSVHSSDPDSNYDQEEEQPARALSSKRLRRIPVSESEMSSPPSTATTSLSAFDTGGYSIIDRSSSPALTGGWDPSNEFLPTSHPYLRIPEPGYDSPRSLSPHAFAPSPPRGSVHTSRSITPVAGVGRGTRPPIAGAVPTVLSGLSIHQIPKLRPTQPRSPKQLTAGQNIHSDMPMFARPQAAVPNPALLGKQRPPVDPLLQELARVRLNPTPPKQNPIFEDNSPPRLSAAGGDWMSSPFHGLKPVKMADSSTSLPRPSSSPLLLERKPTLRPVATLPREMSHSTTTQPHFLEHQLKPVQRPPPPTLHHPHLSDSPLPSPSSPDSGVFPRIHPPPPPPPPPPPLPAVPITGQGGCLPRNFPKQR